MSGSYSEPIHSSDVNDHDKEHTDDATGICLSLSIDRSNDQLGVSSTQHDR